MFNVTFNNSSAMSWQVVLLLEVIGVPGEKYTDLPQISDTHYRKCCKITPQTAMFNDEDFYSVEILETVVRQSGVLAHRQKCLVGKVTSVSIQAFVEGLLILANVSEATNGTYIYIYILTL